MPALRRRSFLQLESCEERTVPTTIVVTGTGDTIAVDGLVTLREAITAANTNAVSGDAPAGSAGQDTINFNIAGAPGTVHTINVIGSALPAITERIAINGYSQLGASPNTLAVGDNAFLAIEINGAGAGFIAGLNITAGNSTVQGLIINRFSNEGILLTTGGGNIIRGNFLGTDATGKIDRGNGITGISILTSGNTIGGTAPADRNLISGNDFAGISLLNSGINNNLILGNYIGTDDTGIAALPNNGTGIRVLNVTGNTIGGTTAGAGNRIAFNNGRGVTVDNNAGPGNAILGNEIYSNANLGIDLANDGPTANDPQDADTGANGLQNAPVVASAVTSATGTSIAGSLNSTPGEAFRVEFFSNTAADPSGFGEGRTFLGSVNVVTDSAGNGSYSLTPAAAVPVGQFITATATDLLARNTSEFSAAIAVVSPPPPPAPTLGSGVLALGGAADGSAKIFTPSASGQYAATSIATLSPFGQSSSTLRFAVADVNDDGTPDTVLVNGPGSPIRVAVVSGTDNSTLLVQSFDPFGGNFTGGGFISAGDLDGDGRAEFIVSPDLSGGPRVSIFSLNPDGTTATRANYFGIDDANFRGGARTALADVDGNGTPELIVCAGFGGGPRTAIFDGTTVLSAPTRLVNDFFAFPGTDAVNLRNGVFVAGGDVNGDGKADLAFGGGPGGAPRVFILGGAEIAAGNVAGAQANPIANFFVANNASDRGGVRLAVKSADGDNRADVVAASGEGSPSRVRVYLGSNFSGSGEPATFQDIDPYGGAVVPGGVFVG